MFGRLFLPIMLGGVPSCLVGITFSRCLVSLLPFQLPQQRILMLLTFEKVNAASKVTDGAARDPRKLKVPLAPGRVAEGSHWDVLCCRVLCCVFASCCCCAVVSLVMLSRLVVVGCWLLVDG